jgi:hypothetical protein
MTTIRFETAQSAKPAADQMRQMARGMPIYRSGTAHELMPTPAPVFSVPAHRFEATFFDSLLPGLPGRLATVGRRLVNVDCLGIINILNNYRQNRRRTPSPAKTTPRRARIHSTSRHADPPTFEASRLLNDLQARSRLVSEMSKIVSTLEASGSTRRASQAIIAALRENSEF